jgi:hypothetical protein
VQARSGAPTGHFRKKKNPAFISVIPYSSTVHPYTKQTFKLEK